MTDDRMVLMEALQQAGDGNFRRSLATTVLQILMETDVAGLIGACRDERSGGRATWRNGGHVRQGGGNQGVTEAASFQAASVEICSGSGLVRVAMRWAMGSVCM